MDSASRGLGLARTTFSAPRLLVDNYTATTVRPSKNQPSSSYEPQQQPQNRQLFLASKPRSTETTVTVDRRSNEPAAARTTCTQHVRVNNGRRRKSTRRVSFLRLVKCREIASLADYTSDELEASWHTDRDFDTMREQTRPIIKKMRKLHKAFTDPASINPEEDCFIGLDHLRSRSVLEELRRQRKDLTAAALFKQMTGRRRDIASMSRELTEQSRRDARERGLHQAQETRSAWKA